MNSKQRKNLAAENKKNLKQANVYLEAGNYFKAREYFLKCKEYLKNIPEERRGSTYPTYREDVEKIDRFDPDFSAFMRPDVDPAVQQAALKKMFSDPHFNVMDGLDIYIEDYSNPELLPPEMLRGLVQSDLLGIFKASDDAASKSSKEAEVAPIKELADQDIDSEQPSALTSPTSLQKQAVDNTTDNLAQKKNITEDKS